MPTISTYGTILGHKVTKIFSEQEKVGEYTKEVDFKYSVKKTITSKVNSKEDLGR